MIITCVKVGAVYFFAARTSTRHGKTYRATSTDRGEALRRLYRAVWEGAYS